MSVTEDRGPKGLSGAAPFAKYFGWWTRRSESAKVNLVLGLLVFIGIALRLWHFAGGRSFFIDEAYMALNLVDRSFQGILGTLDYSQTAPLGWLLCERAMLSLFGWMAPEYSLRLPSVVASVASVLIFAPVVKRHLSLPGAITALLAFALSDQLLCYSSMLKQYGVDVFFSVAFMWVGARLFIDRTPLTWTGLAGLTVAGLLSVTLSFPSAFVLGSLGGLLFLQELLEGRRLKALGVAVASALWLGAFVAMMLSIQSAQASTIETMQTVGWDNSFAPFPPLSASDIKWYIRTGGHVLHFMFQPPAIALVIITVIAGAVALFRKNRMFLAFLVLPLAFALCASAVKYYPFAGRLLLFLFPLVYFIVGAGVDMLVDAFGTRFGRSIAAFALIAGLSFNLVLESASYYRTVSTPFGFEDIKPALKMVADKKEKGDAVYVYFAAYPAFKYYRDRTGLADATVIQGSISRYDWGCYFRDIERIRSHGRVWMVFSHATFGSNMDDFRTMRYLADEYGDELLFKEFGLDHKPFGNVKVLLVDFSGPKAAKPALPFAVPKDADTVCIRKGAIS